jgi:phenylalanine-4-hydroxylase
MSTRIQEAPLAVQNYSTEDDRTWQAMNDVLRRHQDKCAHQGYLEQRAEMLDAERRHVPQPFEVSAYLRKKSNFRIVTAAGTVPGGEFFANLRHRRFTAMPIVRPYSDLHFSAAPDWLHEYMGHAISLGDSRLSDLYQCFGKAAARSTEKKHIRVLGRLYWYICEVGLVRESGSIKAFGAAILSSLTEIVNFPQANQLPFDLNVIAKTAYDYGKNVQPTYFVADTAEQLLDATRTYLDHFPESYHE